MPPRFLLRLSQSSGEVVIDLENDIEAKFIGEAFRVMGFQFELHEYRSRRINHHQIEGTTVHWTKPPIFSTMKGPSAWPISFTTRS